MQRIIKVLLILSLYSSNDLLADEYILPPPQSVFDTSQDYYFQLLKLALKKSGRTAGSDQIKYHTQVLTQNRAIAELVNDTNRITIHKMGTTPERESSLLPIRVPLIQGILGYRIFIIRKEMKKTFAEVKSIKDLKSLRACQGSHWPDTEILRHAGLTVIDSPNYEAMFKMLSAGRCDYFPRAIHEAVGEVEARKEEYPNLILEESLMLNYVFPMYFFVNINDNRMAYRVEKGLLMAIEDQSFESFMKNHPTTSHIFPLSKWKNRRVFDLQNPLLPHDTPLENRSLWVNLKY